MSDRAFFSKHRVARMLQAADLVVALALAAGSIVSQAMPAQRGPTAWIVVACIVTTGSVALRRRAPQIAVVVAATGLLALQYSGFGGQLYLEPLALLLDCYTFGRSAPDLRLGDLVVVAYALAVLLAIAVGTGGQGASDVLSGWVIFVLGPFAVGRTVVRQSVLRSRLRSTLDDLTREQQLRADQAADEERSRIARELHDEIAHGLSVMVIQTAVARRRMVRNRPSAVAALQAVVQAGREVLGEFRRIVGVVSSDGDTPEALPGLAQLDRLVSRTRGAGVVVDIRTEGLDRPLPRGLDLVAYRIVQEALTNVVKHAGAATAKVLVACGEGALELDITNTASGTHPPPLPVSGGPGPGYGLLGMQERVALFGGDFTSGPRPDGGFSVHALLPYAMVAP